MVRRVTALVVGELTQQGGRDLATMRLDDLENESYPESGSPQGGIISLLLASVFLHYVLDVWFEQEVKPRLRGRAYLIRYADDFVIGFTREDDARRVLDVLPKRLRKYGLTVQPDKTRLVPFQQPRPEATGEDDDQRPGTFTLLGFTHYWGRSRKGRWVVKRKTASKRLSRAIRSIAPWCRWNRHRPVREQHATLSQKVRGHYACYGITGQRPLVGQLPGCSPALLAQVAQPPRPPANDGPGQIQSAAAALFAPAAEDCPLGVPSPSQPMIRGTVRSNASTYGSVEVALVV